MELSVVKCLRERFHDLCSHIGVAISVPTHPGSKGKGAGANRQLTPRVLLQSSIQLAHVGGDGCPQGLLHNVQPTSSLCITMSKNIVTKLITI